MQIKKGEVKEKIIEVAKQCFRDKGFEKASLREIAKKAGVTKGNIYTYFTSKDQLFCEVVRPAMNIIRSSMKESRAQDYVMIFNGNQSERDAAEASREAFNRFIYSLLDYKEELKLLFLRAAGSSLENFREDAFELYSASAVSFTKSLSEMLPGKEIKMSEMLIHSLASMYLRVIEEILIHEPKKQELNDYIEQMSTLVHHGFANVIKLQLQKEE